MAPGPWSQHDVSDLLERWQQVARSTAAQAGAAPPGARRAWEEAREMARAVVAVLQQAAEAERAANRAWRKARAAEREDAPRLSLVE